jgi:hypothetical protein
MEMPLDLLLNRATWLPREGIDANSCKNILLKLEEKLLAATSADQWEELLTSYQELELRSYELHFTQEQNQFILVYSTCFDYLIELNIRSCVI